MFHECGAVKLQVSALIGRRKGVALTRRSHCARGRSGGRRRWRRTRGRRLLRHRSRTRTPSPWSCRSRRRCCSPLPVERPTQKRSAQDQTQGGNERPTSIAFRTLLRIASVSVGVAAAVFWTIEVGLGPLREGGGGSAFTSDDEPPAPSPPPPRSRSRESGRANCRLMLENSPRSPEPTPDIDAACLELAAT